LYFDAVFPGFSGDPLPRRVTVGVADALYLIESRDGIPNVIGVIYRFFSLLWKRELLARSPLLILRARPGRFVARLASSLMSSHSDTSFWLYF